jgi:hypothetical protein
MSSALPDEVAAARQLVKIRVRKNMPGLPSEIVEQAAEQEAERDWQSEIENARSVLRAIESAPPSYNADFLRTWNKSVDFLTDRRFMSAYQRGMDSGHVIGRPAGSRDDIHIEWRIHTCCWAGRHASRLPGAFVECGTNTGIMSLAVCEYIDFNATGKRFFLFDTFEGIPLEQISQGEAELGRASENKMYPDCWEIAQRNFAPFPNTQLIRGRVPDSLPSVDIGEVCYLCIDMNIAAPERAAIEYFWDRLVPGAPVIFDDYGWLAYREQKQTLDDFARSKGVEILTLPTGQGLLLKS